MLTDSANKHTAIFINHVIFVFAVIVVFHPHDSQTHQSAHSSSERLLQRTFTHLQSFHFISSLFIFIKTKNMVPSLLFYTPLYLSFRIIYKTNTGYKSFPWCWRRRARSTKRKEKKKARGVFQYFFRRFYEKWNWFSAGFVLRLKSNITIASYQTDQIISWRSNSWLSIWR